MDLIAWIELAQSGGLFAFSWVVYQELRELRRLFHTLALTLSALEERTRQTLEGD